MWKLALVFILGVGSIVHGQSNLDEWFRAYRIRDTKLLRCEENVDGIKFRLPSLPNCLTPTIENANHESVIVTSYFQDSSSNPISGFECYKESYINVVTEYFFGLYTPVLIRQSQKFETISFDSCRTMISTMKTAEGEDLVELGSGIKGTKNNEIPSSKFLGDATATNINFYVVSIHIAINPETNFIEPLGTSTIKNCLVDAGECETIKGVLIWKKDDHKTCRIKVGIPTPCLKTGDTHITCRQTLTSIENWKLTEMCGVSVAVDLNGIHFSTNKTGELHPKIGSHEEIIKAMHLKHANRIAVLNNSDSGKIGTEQFTAHLNFVTSTINLNDESIISAFHITDCRLNKLTLSMHIQEASRGNINGLITGLIGDNTYRGALAGDLVSIWKCRPIDTYHFVLSNNCTMEQPLRYIENGEEMTGYLTPLTHEIVDAPTIVPCPPQMFHFITSNGTILSLKLQKIVEHVQTLPNPGAAILPNTTEFISLAPEAIYNGKDKPNRGLSLEAKALNNALMIGVIVEKMKYGDIPLEESEWSFLSDAFANFGNIIKTLIQWSKSSILAFIFIIILILLVMICGRRGLTRVIAKIFGLFFGAWNCVGNLSVKGKERKIEDRYDHQLPMAPPMYQNIYPNYQGQYVERRNDF